MLKVAPSVNNRRRRPRAGLAGGILGVLGLSLGLSTAHGARPLDPEPWVHVVTGLSAVAGIVLIPSLVPTSSEPWEHELLAWDTPVRTWFSDHASRVSDTTFFFSVVAGALSLASLGDDFGRSMAVYGQTGALTALVTLATKSVVGRPRPYTYNPNPRVQRWAAAQGADGYRSFMSGHTSGAFGAAVSASYLVGLQSDDTTYRAGVWGTLVGSASVTAVMRVRAGRHFPTDVVAGAVVGGGLGVLVPLLNARNPERYRLSGEEAIGLGAGLLLGTLLGMVWPVDADISEPLESTENETEVAWGVVPSVHPRSAQLALVGRW